MTQDELNRIEGELSSAYRNSRATLAALGHEIQQYADNLKSASHYLGFFLSAPLAPATPALKGGKEFLDSMMPQEIEANLAEYMAEWQRRTDLEAKLREFGR